MQEEECDYSFKKNKHVPKGGYSLEQKKNYNLIKNYILCKQMYLLTAPFRYQFLSYVVVSRKDPKLGRVQSLYHQASKRLILTAYPINSQIGSKLVIKCGKTDEIVARLRGDFMKTKYQLFDSGFNPKKNKFPVRKQFAFIQMIAPSFLSNEPSTISCVLANHKRISLEKQNQPFSCCFEAEGVQQIDASVSEIQKLKAQNSKKVYSIESIKPKYCQNKKGFIMDMKGLVTEPSPINTVLMTLGQDQCLIMGKRSENTYLLYVGAPLTLLQGFGIFLANMTEKKI